MKSNTIMIKAFNKLGLQGTFFNLIRAISNNIFKDEWLKNQKDKIRNKKMKPMFSTFIQHFTRDSNQAIRQHKEIKGTQNIKGAIKLSPLKLIQSYIETNKWIGKVVQYKNNTEKKINNIPTQHKLAMWKWNW